MYVETVIIWRKHLKFYTTSGVVRQIGPQVVARLMYTGRSHSPMCWKTYSPAGEATHRWDVLYEGGCEGRLVREL
jgi:hypothetical protein